MASSESRRRIEIPVSLYTALVAAAEGEDLGTSTLAGTWLYRQLKELRPDLAPTEDPYRSTSSPRARRSDAGTAKQDRRGTAAATRPEPRPKIPERVPSPTSKPLAEQQRPAPPATSQSMPVGQAGPQQPREQRLSGPKPKRKRHR